MNDISPNTAASLGTDGHIYCAGTLSQCVYRWNRLPADKKAHAYLKMGRDGVAAKFVRGEELTILASTILNGTWRAKMSQAPRPG